VFRARKKAVATIRAKAFLRLQERARQHGGMCLSHAYLGNRERHAFRCKFGHIWQTRPRNVHEDHWCPECVRESAMLGLERMQRLARKRGGRCISERYIHSQTKLRFSCAEGHIFRLSPACLSRGQWCGQCAYIARRLRIEEMRAIARSRGGRCLSKTYLDCETHLLWMCADGHVWPAIPNNVKNKRTWCPECRNGRTRPAERRDWITRK
jgi:hypothetical protein